MMPNMPATLEMRFPPWIGPSFNRKSPDGRSTTSVGADCEEGEVKAYDDAEAWTLMSRNGEDEEVIVAEFNAIANCGPESMICSSVALWYNVVLWCSVEVVSCSKG